MPHDTPQETPTFDREAINTLAREFSIPESKKDELANILEMAARKYYWAEGLAKDAESLAKTRAILEKLKRRALAVQETLEELPKDIIRTFEEITIYDSLEFQKKGKFASHVLPTLTLENIDGEPDESIILVEIAEVSEHMKAIARLSQKTNEQLPKGTTGRKSNEALSLWIAYLAYYWRKDLGRKFTRDELSGGVAVSEAARFCVQTSSYLDQDIPSSLILKAMKKYIKNNK